MSSRALASKYARTMFDAVPDTDRATVADHLERPRVRTGHGDRKCAEDQGRHTIVDERDDLRA